MKRWMAMGLALALMLACAGLAEAGSRELSDWYGRDIRQAAEALGGLTYSEGTEFKDNYVGDTLALRGRDGKVDLIELLAPAEGSGATAEGSDATAIVPDITDDRVPDALCGVTIGMKREDVLALMEGMPMPWEYDEEIAWIVRADAQDELNSVMLVAFFDEAGKVCGAWYRASTV